MEMQRFMDLREAEDLEYFKERVESYTRGLDDLDPLKKKATMSLDMILDIGSTIAHFDKTSTETILREFLKVHLLTWMSAEAHSLYRTIE